MIRRPPRSTLDRSSAASDVYKRQVLARMRRAGTVSPGDVSAAALEPPLSPTAARSFLAPHFTAALLGRLTAEGRVPEGDLHTPLDLPLQEALEAEARHTVETMKY